MAGKEVSTLLLSQDDLLKVGVTNMADCIDVIEGVFSLIGKGDYLMGGPLQNEHGQMIYFPEEERFPGMPVTGPDRRFMSMIGYLGGKYKICGEKWYGSNPANPARGLPRSILTTILNDADTGAPFAIMSGNQISAMRTGAVPGVVARHLSRKGTKTVGVIGGGVINRGALLALKTSVPSIEEAVLYDINLEKGKQWAEEESKVLGIKITATTSIEEAVRQADIVSVATGGNVFPRIEEAWLKPGTLVIFTGDADMDPDVYARHTVFADNWKMHQAFLADGAEHPKGLEAVSVVAPSYHLLLAIQQGKYDQKDIRNLGDVVNGIDKGRTSDEEVIFFMTGGMPLHDIAWGKTLYDRAVEAGLGEKFCFFKEAYWH